MEFGPDSIITSDLGFITQIQKVFSVEEVTIPEDSCSLVAVAVRYGLVFCGNGNIVKVFQTQALLNEGDPAPVSTIDLGIPVTHVSVSCDGLTLLVVALQDDKPRVIFYDSRSLISGNENPFPFAAKSLCGARVQAVSWNPRDPSSVAISTGPEDLSIITLEDNRIEVKSKAIKARALSWSPKGKQLTVGLADGTLSLFKPDLQLVRNVKSPPMNGIGSVQSLTWFSNTEFFIAYTLESEEGGQVLMYVNAPKAQEPRFVAYEYICNDNVGPLPPMFYQTFLQEWSTLCLTSSRAAQLGMLGATGDGPGWCEYELEEGKQAVMHCINITDTTYALGMAVDFTSQKIFSHKDGSTSGPCPVIFILSTGGELNIFHVVNSRPGLDSLVAPPEMLPRTGQRTLEQNQGAGSPLPAAPKQAFAPPSTGGMFSGAIPAKPFMSGSGTAPSFGTKPSFEGLGGSLFGGTSLQHTLPKFTTQAPPVVPLGGGITLGSSMPIQILGTSTGAFTPTGDVKADLRMKLTQGKMAGDASQVKQQQMSFVPTPIKSQTPSPAPSSPLPKAAESQTSSKSQSPFASYASTATGKEPEDTAVLDVITAAVAQFEEELQNQLSYNSCYMEVSKEDMGSIRRHLTEESVWIKQMYSTTSELMVEVKQLHTEVLQGFKLGEEADAHICKRKNPRHFQNKQSRQLDPHSRKSLEDIRSKYQYLKSQLDEVNSQLHLEWVSYTEATKSKKKRDSPVAETVYKALMKCHTLRTKQERELEILCERLKSYEMDSLSRGLRVNRNHNNDEFLANLEKSLREVQISPTAYVSPVKNLSQGKQEKLQKILSQRTTIPVRKFLGSPKLKFEDISRLTESSPRKNKLGQSFSFSPQTSTPNRQSNQSTTFGDTSNSDFKSPSPDADGSIENEYATGELSSRTTGFFVNTSTDREKTTGFKSVTTSKPLYEDITPPQTPAVRTDMESKSPSPLVALSSLVSKVPTKTTSADTAPAVSISEARTGFAEAQGPSFSFASSSSNPMSFSFKSQPSSVRASGTDISEFGNKLGNKFLPQFTSANLSDTQVLSPASVTGSQITPLPKSTASTDSTILTTPGLGQLSYKTSPAANSGLFSLTLPSSSSLSLGADNSASKSSFTVVSSANSLSFFGSVLSSSLSVTNASSSGGTVPTLGTQSSKPIGTESSLFATISGSPFKISTKDFSKLSTGDKSSESNPILAATISKVSESSIVSSKNNASLPSTTSETTPSGLLVVPKSSTETDKASASAAGGSSFFGKSGGSSLSASITPSTGSLFQSSSGTTTGSLFGGAVTINLVKTSDTTTSGVLGGTSTTTPSIFGNAKGTEASSIFGTTSLSSGSALGPPQTSSSAKSSEEAVSTAGSSGGDSKSTVVSLPSGGSLFGGIAAFTTSASSSSIFGSAPATTSGGSAFGSISTPAASSGGSILGSALTTTTTTGGSIFGGTTASTTTTSSLFGSISTTSTASGGGIFGGGSTQTTTSGGSVFGAATPSTATGGSVFVGATVPSTGSVFGGASSPASSTGSVFGGVSTAAAPSTGSVFGGASTAAASSTGSVFGGAASPAAPSAGSVFGGATTAVATTPGTQVGGTVPDSSTMDTGFSSLANASSTGTGFGQQSAFGTLSQSTSGTVFSSATSTTGGSIFGQKAGGSSVFGQTTQSASTPLFGGQSSTGSLFGGTTSQEGSVFGASVAKGSSIFGGAAMTSTGASLFNPTVTSASNTTSGGLNFGQSPAAPTSPFAATSTTTQGGGSLFSGSSFLGGNSGGGGGFFSGLGSKPSEETANKNIFGGTSFTSAKPQLSLFGGGSQSTTGSFEGGQSSANSFGACQTSTGQAFGSTAFGGTDTSGGGNATVLQSGFNMTTPTKSPGFGSGSTFGGSAVFGGAPAFGSPPKFGSSPAFGGSATFGSVEILEQQAVDTLSGGSAGMTGGFGSFSSPGGTTFGAVAGSSSTGGGFGSFSGQSNTSTFGGVAQQSPGQQQTPFGGSGNAFSGGSSFNTWR